MLSYVKNKPYSIIWWMIPLVLLVAIVRRNVVIDIQLHDTYIVSSALFIGFLMAIGLGFNGVLYWLFRHKSLVGWMTIFHMFVLVLLSFIVLSFFVCPGVFLPLNHQNIGDDHFYVSLNASILTGVIVLLFAQFIFILNLIIGMVRNQLMPD